MPKSTKFPRSTKSQATRDAILNDTFNDLYSHRGRIYRTNFFRGIFFGLGTFIGGTIVVTIVVAVFSWLASTFNFGPFQQVVDIVEDARK